VTDGQTDRQTDGIAMAYTRYSIYAVARNNEYHGQKMSYTDIAYTWSDSI